MQTGKKAIAMMLGQRRYFTGKPCKNGHTVARYTNTGACVDCVYKYNQKGKKSPFNVKVTIELFDPKDYEQLKAFADALNMQSRFENDERVRISMIESQKRIEEMANGC